MQESAIGQRTRHSGGGGKGAHNRETLQTTGFYVGRIVFVPREFAPIPHAPAGLAIPMAIRMRFLRHDGIYRSDVVPTATNPGAGPLPPPAGRPRAQVKERVGRTTPFSSSAMSSGRLFLDRVARQHCPSPLHRHAQTTMHPLTARPKPDISTLQRIGHFYFALTALTQSLWRGAFRLLSTRVSTRTGQCWLETTLSGEPGVALSNRFTRLPVTSVPGVTRS